MSPHNLQLMLQMEALRIRVIGMEQSNKARELDGHPLAYTEGDFEYMACEADKLMQEVSYD